MIHAKYTQTFPNCTNPIQTLMSAGIPGLVTTIVGTQKEATPVPVTLDTLSQGVQDV